MFNLVLVFYLPFTMFKFVCLYCLSYVVSLLRPNSVLCSVLVAANWPFAAYFINSDIWACVIIVTALLPLVESTVIPGISLTPR